MIQRDSMTQREWGKAIALGLINGILLAVIMVTLKKSGLSPMPAPLGLAFADTISGRHLPLPIGLLFHLAYVTFWSVVFVALFRPHLTFARAAMLAAGLCWGGRPNGINCANIGSNNQPNERTVQWNISAF
ncbi:MAG: hypothetical protein B7Z57_14050, partial [Acidiphilium sp. 37-60-79]